MLTPDEITEILSKELRSRERSYEVVNEFLGLPKDYRPPPPTKKMRRKWKWEARKDRIRRAYQILRYGYYEGEGCD